MSASILLKITNLHDILTQGILSVILRAGHANQAGVLYLIVYVFLYCDVSCIHVYYYVCKSYN